MNWFGSFRKPLWEVGKAREAHADVRGGRYQIRRDAEAFIVRYCEPYLAPDVLWKDIGTAATEAEAVALAETHNEARPAFPSQFATARSGGIPSADA